MHRSEYDPSLAAAVLDEAAGLLKAIGYAAQHVILIGGSVPGLLVPQLDPGIEPHLGTTDLDFCLSVAIVEGNTTEYQRIEQGLKQAGFEPVESWRWRGGPDGRLLVEFFCPAGPGREPGRLFRPKREESPVAKHNLGATLSAMALEMGELISADVQVIRREVDLPGGKGKQLIEFRVAGLVAFLAAKADALLRRDKPKDAYDIVWLLEAWPGGPAGAAEAVRRSPHADHRGLAHALDLIEDQFRDLDRAGARLCRLPGRGGGRPSPPGAPGSRSHPGVPGWAQRLKPCAVRPLDRHRGRGCRVRTQSACSPPARLTARCCSRSRACRGCR